MDGKSSYHKEILRNSMVFNSNGSKNGSYQDSYSYSVNSSTSGQNMNNMGRSYITTTYDHIGNDQMRRSRIQNLPNYKKINLGQNLQFIVVFQTIEIQRLSQEIQVLRVRNKQYERRIHNAQSYEVQIRQLTERCFASQKQTYQYREQLERLNKICQTLYHQNQMFKIKLTEMDVTLKQRYQSEVAKNGQLMHEVQKWKMRCTAIQKSKSKELEDLRAMLESQRKSMVDRQIRQATIRFQNQRSTLQSQIKKGRELIQNRNRQIQIQKQKLQKYQIQIMQLRGFQNALAQGQARLAMLNNQIYRLTNLLKDKQGELATFRQKQQRLMQQVNMQKGWQVQKKQLSLSLQQYKKEVGNWKSRASRLQEQVSKAKDSQLYRQEIQRKLNLAMNEVDRLNIVLKTKLDEIQNWKKRVSERDNQLSLYKNMQNQIHSYETKLKNLQIQNDRINGIQKSRLSEIQDWKNRYNNLQQTVKRQANIQNENKGLTEKINMLIKENERNNFNTSKLQNDISSLRRYQSQAKDAERNNANLTKEIQRLNNLLKSQGGQLNDFRVRYQKIQQTLGQYKNTEAKLRDYDNKIKLLNVEHGKLNDLLKQRNDMINGLESEKVQMLRKINHYKNYEIKINQNEQTVLKLQQNNDKLKKDIDSWQNKYKQAETRVRQLDGNLFKLNSQKQKLNSMVKAKNNQYQQLRTQYGRIQMDARKNKQFQGTINQLQNHINGLMSDIDAYQRKLKTVEQQMQRQKSFSNEFAFKVIVLSCEIQRLHQEGASMGKNKSKQYLELQESFTKLQSKVQSKNSEIDMLVSKITSLESRISQILNDYSRILKQVQRSEQESRSFMKQIQQYQEYARRIAILGAEIDRLTQLNRAAEDDIKRMRLKYSGQIEIQRREQSLLIKIFLMTVQIQSLRAIVEKKILTEDEMRKSYLDPIRKV